MAERNIQHSHDMQNKAMCADIDDAKAGRAFGFLALIALIAAACFAVYLDKEILAGLFLGAGALGVIGQLINGKQSKPDGEQPQ